MIEKFFLPMRWRNENLFGKFSFHHSHLLREKEVGTASNKKVDVIGHYDVASDADSALFTFDYKLNELIVDFSICEKLLAFMCIERQKYSGGSYA